MVRRRRSFGSYQRAGLARGVGLASAFRRSGFRSRIKRTFVRRTRYRRRKFTRFSRRVLQAAAEHKWYDVVMSNNTLQDQFVTFNLTPPTSQSGGDATQGGIIGSKITINRLELRMDLTPRDDSGGHTGSAGTAFDIWLNWCKKKPEPMVTSSTDPIGRTGVPSVINDHWVQPNEFKRRGGVTLKRWCLQNYVPNEIAGADQVPYTQRPRIIRYSRKVNFGPTVWNVTTAANINGNYPYLAIRTSTNAIGAPYPSISAVCRVYYTDA